MQYTGNQMRQELQFVMEALRLQEQFIKDEDPTIVIGKVIEGIGLHLSNLQAAYKKGSDDRNSIVSASLSEIDSMMSILQDAKSALSSPSSPEDNDRSI